MGNRALAVVLAFAGTAYGQTTITFSHQPLSSFQAVFGGKLANVAAYSAVACNPAGTTIAGGLIRQAAEGKGIDVVDLAFTGATGNRAQSMSKTARGLSVLKWFSVGETAVAAPIAVMQSTEKQLATKMAAGGAIVGAVVQAIELPLNTAQAATQAAANQVLANALDPARSYQVPVKGCAAGVIFYGAYIKGFVPVTVTLP